jgi:hypothetical protein
MRKCPEYGSDLTENPADGMISCTFQPDQRKEFISKPGLFSGANMLPQDGRNTQRL